MARRLSEADKQWFKDNPGFHVMGKTSLGLCRSTNSDASDTRAKNENDQHWYELHRTFSRKLEEAADYDSLIES